MSERGQKAAEARPDDVLTLAEAAAHLRVPEGDLAALAADGGVPARKIGQEWRFSRGALDDWLRHGGRDKRELLLLPLHWSEGLPFIEGLTSALEARLIQRLKVATSEAPRQGSKQAVLQHFGQFEGDDDLEDRLADARARREAVG